MYGRIWCIFIYGYGQPYTCKGLVNPTLSQTFHTLNMHAMPWHAMLKFFPRFISLGHVDSCCEDENSCCEAC